jgi:tellurite resistance protein TerC
VIGKFHLLKPALAGVLAFVGTKMLVVDFYKVPITASLGVIAVLIAIGIAGSLLFPKPAQPVAGELKDASTRS